ncbi:protein IWS1 homolog isoform X2 [Synchiropus splendidus]|uniref:protein IWS1 homolog isoform X2 n=1 Tax=Synchiropus splendidus TaxID=270530 RepID=UPI00237EA5AC|nr:protein IWS1 homolog isoform X2 [Synchiropus splendidus]
MSGEEDDVMSGSHSDEDDDAVGGRTPVLDEHESDGENVTSGMAQSEGDCSNDEDSSHHMETKGADSESEAERRRVHGCDSDADEGLPLAQSDDEASSQHKSYEGSSQEKGSPVSRGSDTEDGGSKVAAHSDSDNTEYKPEASSNNDSDAEGRGDKGAQPLHSEEEEEEEEEPGRKRGGRWKAVVQSDSEDDDEEGEFKRSAESDKDEKHSSGEDKPVKRKAAILSDSEDEDDKPAGKRKRSGSQGESSDSDRGSEGPDESLAAKLRELGSDSSDEEQTSRPEPEKKKEELFGSDSESGGDDDDEEEKMIADIFGESGDEEEFTGFNQEDLEGDKKEAEPEQQMEDSDSDEGVDRSGHDTSFMSDFDIMLARKKAMSGKKRRHRDGGTFISDADDVVSAMITKMNEAAEEDRALNGQKKPALKKLTLLPQVVMHLKKQDLKETFIDSGVMSAIKEWISPLPDKSLPALRIREELLRILQELPSVSQETLKHSGIGRAVMFLYKHPKESRPNKDLALKLISEFPLPLAGSLCRLCHACVIPSDEWSRPIFGLTSNYKGMTREERQQRDLDQQMPQRRRLRRPNPSQRPGETADWRGESPAPR